MTDYVIPTQILYESARREFKEVIQKAKTEYKLPAYLLEGLLTNELAELRNQKCDEIAQGYSDIVKQVEAEKQNVGEEDATV